MPETWQGQEKGTPHSEVRDKVTCGEQTPRQRPEEQLWQDAQRAKHCTEEKGFAKHCFPGKPSIILSVSQTEATRGEQLQIISKAPGSIHGWKCPPPRSPATLTSLLHSRKTSLVRTRQEESTMVCFMTLSRQVAGAECSGTWGAKRENTGGPRTVNPGAPKRPSPRARPLQATPPTSRSRGRPRPTFWVSAHRGLTFQEFPKSTGSSSTWRLLLVRSLFWTPSKFPHRPHTRSWGTSGGERELCKPRGKLAESGGRGFRAAGEADSPEEKEEGRGWEGGPEGDQGGQQSLNPAKAFGLFLH